MRADLSYNWGLSGPLPPAGRFPRLESMDILVTQACAPAGWRDGAAAIELEARSCESGTDVTVDVAVFHTPAAREESGGAAAIAAVIDLMVAETNQAYAASGVHHRLRLVERSEVAYNETGNSGVDLRRFADPSDGHMDEVHAVRDRVGADLVHLIAEVDDVCGRAYRPGAFGLTDPDCGGRTLAHELGHNMGLSHDRYQVHHNQRGARPHPAYGYVNQPALGAGALPSRRWRTIMAYPTQCIDAYTRCSSPLRFSNPRQLYNGDPLGAPFGAGGSGATGPADAAAVLDATGPVVALWRDRPAGANRPPAAAGALPDRTLTLPGAVTVDVSRAFVDPDGDLLAYAVSSSAPDVVTVLPAGARVTLTAVGEGAATVRVTATDPGGPERGAVFHGDGGESQRAARGGGEAARRSAAGAGRHPGRGRVAGVRRPRRRCAGLRGVVVRPAGGDGAGGGLPRDVDGGGRGRGDSPGDGDRPRRPERGAVFHGDGGESQRAARVGGEAARRSAAGAGRHPGRGTCRGRSSTPTATRWPTRRRRPPRRW